MDQDLCSDGMCRITQAGKLAWLDRGLSGSVKNEDSVNGKMEKTAETVEQRASGGQRDGGLQFGSGSTR
ncbi:hypothetical protein PG984_007274 [Apiospora sp. TS-2023a]